MSNEKVELEEALCDTDTKEALSSLQNVNKQSRQGSEGNVVD